MLPAGLCPERDSRPKKTFQFFIKFFKITTENICGEKLKVMIGYCFGSYRNRMFPSFGHHQQHTKQHIFLVHIFLAVQLPEADRIQFTTGLDFWTA